jgi:hypothetical protein
VALPRPFTLPFTLGAARTIPRAATRRRSGGRRFRPSSGRRRGTGPGCRRCSRRGRSPAGRSSSGRPSRAAIRTSGTGSGGPGPSRASVTPFVPRTNISRHKTQPFDHVALPGQPLSPAGRGARGRAHGRHLVRPHRDRSDLYSRNAAGPARAAGLLFRRRKRGDPRSPEAPDPSRATWRWSVGLLCPLVQVGITRCILFIASAGQAWAQAGTGTLTGSVRDSQGGALPGTTVTATNNATGAVRTTVANETGSFNMPGLTPGTYTVARVGRLPHVRPRRRHRLASTRRRGSNRYWASARRPRRSRSPAPRRSSTRATPASARR